MNSFYQGKTVLVTGAAGFIGSHLTDALLSRGAIVYGVDNFITGNKRNIVHLADNANFHFIEADVTGAPESYLSSLSSPLSCVFHLASPASPNGYQAHPVETYLVNSIGTHNLLQFLVEKHQDARFLYTSTSESYGDPLEHPQKETYWGNVNPNGPRSMYDEGKRLGETICGVHVRSFNIDCRIARIFNTYGPRMDINDGRVIPGFVKSLLENTPLQIHGGGTQTRSFCFVSDLVSGLLSLMEVDSIAGETINLGNPHEITILTLAQKLSEIAHIPLQTTNTPSRADDPNRRCPDITKAKNLLSWEPKVDLETGLTETFAFYSKPEKKQ
ncbi:MAG: GDP-mannose 4,6-dehydratase [Candidatus Woesebacteria bacterium]